MNLRTEQLGIVRTALSYGIQPELVIAIRLLEGDPPADSAYGEWGMPKAVYQTYSERLDGCCATLRGLLMAYLGNPYQIVTTEANHRRLVYLDAVIAFLGRTYCPTGEGAPSKNENWIPGVTEIYQRLTKENYSLV